MIYKPCHADIEIKSLTLIRIRKMIRLLSSLGSRDEIIIQYLFIIIHPCLPWVKLLKDGEDLCHNYRKRVKVKIELENPLKPQSSQHGITF